MIGTIESPMSYQLFTNDLRTTAFVERMARVMLMGKGIVWAAADPQRLSTIVANIRNLDHEPAAIVTTALAREKAPHANAQGDLLRGAGTFDGVEVLIMKTRDEAESMAESIALKGEIAVLAV